MRLAMSLRIAPRVCRLIASAGATTCLVAAISGVALAQAPSGAAGTVKGFVRVNGNALVVRHSYGVTAPDSFDPSQEVQLVLVTPAPISADALARAASRNDVFGLVTAGAVVEIRKNGHNVFLRHSVLGKDQLQTGGGFPEFKTANNRISGDVHTFMSGDEDSFGFKVRFELAFDAPIVKRIPVARPATTAPAATASTAPKAAPGPLPKTRDEAKKWLSAQGYGVGEESLIIYFTLGNGLSADVVRAYMTLGISVNRISEFTGDSALNALTIACPGKPAGAEVAKILLDAGANVNQQESDGRKATPVMGAVFCPEVLPLILAKNPDLNKVDASGLTVMHYALRYGKPGVAKMVKDAGFDMARWRKSLLQEFDAATIDAIDKPAPTGRPAVSMPAPAPPPRSSASPAPRATAVDWKALGPYPNHSKAEAVRLLARPGTDTTVDEHFWDAINHLEPQRLAIALQAGANVRQIRPNTNYTPLIALAESCDLNDRPDEQVSIAEQLIAAGADLTGIDLNKANALIVGADDCPIAMIRALIKAGLPLQAVSATKSTALQAAILDGRVDVVEALLDAGLDPKKEPYNVGKTASGNKAIEAALKKKRK
jgi:ankyrin repeat protein